MGIVLWDESPRGVSLLSARHRFPAVRRLAIRNQQISSNTLQTAALGSGFADDVLRRGLQPVELLDDQQSLREQLRWVEGRLQDLRGRAAKRDARIAARVRRNPALKEIRGAHVALLRTQVRLLERQQVVLRVLGDRLAWLVLDQNPRILLPLYKAGAHQLPAPLSIAGTIMIARRAVAKGNFYIIENDLTRCLGVGDLTVTFSDRAWRRPFSVEVKTSGKLIEGAPADLLCVAAQTDHPADVSLAQAFYEATELRDLPEGAQQRDDPAQSQEMLVRAEVLYAATEVVGQHVSAVSARPWGIIRNVLARALREGMSWDLSEHGVAFFAVKAVNGRPDPDAFNSISDKLRELGLDASSAVTTEDFLDTPHWSTLAQPIPLWPVPVAARAALLNGELVFGCVTTPGVFVQVLRNAGLTVVEANGSWEVSGQFGATRVDQIEVAKLAIGVAFGGVSPREIAQRMISEPPVPDSETGLDAG